MNKATYWNSNGKYQAAVTELHKLIPDEGAVVNARKNPALEKFRNAVNCYYDLNNNGLCNRAAQFARVFGLNSRCYKEPRGRGRQFSGVLYERVETRMDEIVIAAASEQGLTHLLMVEEMKTVSF